MNLRGVALVAHNQWPILVVLLQRNILIPLILWAHMTQYRLKILLFFWYYGEPHGDLVWRVVSCCFVLLLRKCLFYLLRHQRLFISYRCAFQREYDVSRSRFFNEILLWIVTSTIIINCRLKYIFILLINNDFASIIVNLPQKLQVLADYLLLFSSFCSITSLKGTSSNDRALVFLVTILRFGYPFVSILVPIFHLALILNDPLQVGLTK